RAPGRVALTRERRLDGRLELLVRRSPSFELLGIERRARRREREQQCRERQCCDGQAGAARGAAAEMSCDGGHAPTVERGPNRPVTLDSRIANGRRATR